MAVEVPAIDRNHDIGTPDRGSSKVRRINSPYPGNPGSPLEEMDGLDGLFEEAPIPVPAPGTPITLDAFFLLLDRKLDPVARDMAKLTADFSDMKLTFEKRVSSIESTVVNFDAKIALQVKDLQELLQHLESIKQHQANTASEPLSHEGSEMMRNLQEQLRQIETRVTESSDLLDRTRTAVVGGLLHCNSSESACEWLKQALWENWLPQPVTAFVKGEFKGRLWIKYGSEDERDEVLAKIRSLKLKNNGTDIWIKPDFPVEQRVVKSALFGVKWILSDKKDGWGFDRKSLWADVENGTIELGDAVMR